MEKTIYIPKLKECRFDNLICEHIVVNGNLHVNGRLRAKHISGKGFIYAKWITAKSITAHTVDAGTIATDTLVAAFLNADEIHAARCMEVSSVITAASVSTRYITYADAEIWDLQADEAVVLASRRCNLLRTLLASFIRSKWAALTNGKSKEGIGGDFENNDVELSEASQRQEYQTKPTEPRSPELEEAAQLLGDSEFLRLRALYKVTREAGDVWQLVPKTEQNDRAVTTFTAA